MQTRSYCPECASFDIVRLRRGYFNRVFRKVPPQYKCRNCQHRFSEVDLNNNAQVEETFEAENFKPLIREEKD